MATAPNRKKEKLFRIETIGSNDPRFITDTFKNTEALSFTQTLVYEVLGKNEQLVAQFCGAYSKINARNFIEAQGHERPRTEMESW